MNHIEATEINSNRVKEKDPKGSPLIKVSGLSFSTYDHDLFNNATFQVHQNEVVALVGKNGSGKSFLLRSIIGDEIPDSGDVEISNNISISYLPQDIEDLGITESITIKELFWKARGLDNIENSINGYYEKMASGNYNDQDMVELSKLQTLFEHKNGYTAEDEMNTILRGLGLDHQKTRHITPDTKLEEMSSGQKTRVLIGQSLFSDANLLILDDPTSHLDIDSVIWLSRYIKNCKKGVLIATQNIDFVDACADKIVEITDSHRVLSYTGNYSQYIVKRDQILASEQDNIKSKQQEYDSLFSTWQKFKNEGVYKISQNMAARGRAIETRLQRLSNEIKGLPGSQDQGIEQRVRPLVFSTSKRESSSAILKIENPVISYGEFEAIDMSNVNIQLKRGDRYLITGENGSGKSTLLRVIARHYHENFSINKGRIYTTEDLTIGYFAPDNIGINRKGRVIEEITGTKTKPNEAEAVSILTFFGFPFCGLWERTIETLSSGEKKQLALAKIMAIKPDILLLDEPTDNLNSIIMKRLVSAINSYDGTLILISHDTDFKNNLKITHEIELKDGRLTKSQTF
ncbi:MAG: ABC-F family ATP-binding cassette domain-containing protein [Candidatus Shapirobacteria bacterium]|nr:ABC-F family ATP-binding cassette domain-containing protein [Candidatus Shapirobacteria bacterium]MDD4410587.1 ABC-F family ATP-binding cassette domain-containing protein [Candidatus Shapirobacteria bacterium]